MIHQSHDTAIEQEGKRVRLEWIHVFGSLVLALVVPYGAAKFCLKTASHDDAPNLSPFQAGLDEKETTVPKTKETKETTVPKKKETSVPKKKETTVPKTVCANKGFDDGLNNEGTVTNPLSQNQINFDSDFCVIQEEGEDDVNSGPFQPVGQLLLVDIRNVNTAFLEDTETMVRNMVDTFTQSKSKLLSYHCHDLVAPMGVSCVGVLVESHFLFHTWPHAGAIALDLFTCGSGNLLLLIPVLEKLFAVPQEDSQGFAPPVLTWAFKMRGYNNYDAQNGAKADGSSPPVSASSNSERDLLGWVGFGEKKTILVEETDFHQVEVYETFQGGHQYVSQSSTGSYSHTYDKRVYLDGVLQSARNGLAAYHEALVHPAMVANGRLKQRVAIIGGGEGTTLREVLKHNTVTTCTMIEMDREFVDLARTYMPEWNDCSDFVLDANVVGNRTGGSCFDDPRTELFFEDALAWFVDRYGDGKEVQEEDKYDVIIMDALDPSTLVDICHMMYGDERFVSSLVNALEPKQGVLVMQVGEHTYQSDLVSSSTRSSKILVKFEKLLEANGMRAMKSYAEAHGLFSGPWEFRISFMEDSLAHFYWGEARIDWELARRAITTKSQQNPFQYFDGATMASYQYPSRIEEDFFCQTRYEDSKNCDHPRGFNTERTVLLASALEVKPSTYPNAGRGVFLKEDVRAGSYFTVEQNVHNMGIMPEVYWTSYFTSLFLESKDTNDPFEAFHAYLDGYGYEDVYFGNRGYFVDCGIGMFVNHGCNSSYILGVKTPFNELTARPDKYPDYFATDGRLSAFYDPRLDRTHIGFETRDLILADAKAGDEVFSNYLDYLSAGYWADGVSELKAECSGQTGYVTEYETKRKERNIIGPNSSSCFWSQSAIPNLKISCD